MVISPNLAPLPRIYAWFAAVIANDTDLLAVLHAHGVPIDVPHPLRHSTALMEATRRGHATTVQWLLERGAAPAFLCGTPSGTALHCALRCRRWDVAYMIVDTMNSCAVADACGATPLHSICAEPLQDCEQDPALVLASTLIAKDCPLDALDRDGTAALHHCVINDLLSMAELLLIRGANVNAIIPDSRVSSLAIAALEKNMPMAQLLLRYGADPGIKTRDGSSVLSFYPQMVKIISEEDVERKSAGEKFRSIISAGADG